MAESAVIFLSEKIAAVERAISDWDGCSIDARSRDVSVLEAVLADLRAQPEQMIDAGALIQRVLRVLDSTDRSPLTLREEAETIVEGIRDLLAHQIGHPTRLAEARRAGAEEMRSRAAQCVEQIVMDPALSITMRERTAKAIRALPVE